MGGYDKCIGNSDWSGGGGSAAALLLFLDTGANG